MPGGAYSNVQNTGAGISQCSFCAQSVVHAYTWDGDNPSIAVYEPGNGTFLQALPMGAMDPDIVIGNDGNSGVVVYELNGDVEYSTFTYSPGAIGLMAPVVLVNNAGHPNIDVSSDCDKDITCKIRVKLYHSFRDKLYHVVRGKLYHCFRASWATNSAANCTTC
jgi:hypothetical protein